MDDLVGLARDVATDDDLSQTEVEFLQKWLAASGVVIDRPPMPMFHERINDVLPDGVLDQDENVRLMEDAEQGIPHPARCTAIAVLHSTSVIVDRRNEKPT